MNIEDEFIKYWNKRHPDNLAWDKEQQFRPQRKLYDSLETDSSYTDWRKEQGYSDYRADFALINYPILVEFDGKGAGHRGAGQSRDKSKDNQNLLLGYLTLRFSPTTAKASMAYVEDMILDTIDIWFGD